MTYDPLGEETVQYDSGIVGYEAWLANRGLPDEVQESITGSVTKTQTSSGLQYALPGTDGDEVVTTSQQLNDWIGPIGATITFTCVFSVDANNMDFLGVGFGPPDADNKTDDRNFYCDVNAGDIYVDGSVVGTFNAVGTDAFNVLEMTMDNAGKFDWGVRVRGESSGGGGTFEVTDTALPNNPTSVGFDFEDQGNGSSMRWLYGRHHTHLESNIL